MRSGIRSFLQELTGIYVGFIVILLPLYMKERMVMIGDAKYGFFRDITVAFLGVMVIGGLFNGLLSAFAREKFRKNQWSILDCFVAAYGLTSLLSCLCSIEPRIALWGYEDWHMGAFTQILLVGVYFAVSRWYDAGMGIWKLAAISAFLVFSLGILNRLHMDPLGIYEGMAENDWNRMHLLSTIGNNNWYCGYISVTAGIFLSFFYMERGGRRILFGMGTFLMYVTLLTQGSESGYMLLAGALGVLCYVALESREKLLRAWEAILLLPLACVMLKVLNRVNPERMLMDDEGTEGIVALWSGWIIVLVVTAGIYGILVYRQQHKLAEQKGYTRLLRRSMVVVALLGSIGLTVYGASGHNMNWGTARGALWYVAVRCFWEGDWKQKLLGAGPDCFAPCAYNKYDVNALVQVSHRWKDIIYANAHNEWLNMLVTQGLLGLIAYLGIFVSALVRYLKRVDSNPLVLPGLLVLAGYAANATVSFQHVMAAPFLFVLLGVNEAVLRRRK